MRPAGATTNRTSWGGRRRGVGGDPEGFPACLRDEGLDIPEGQVPGPGAIDRSDPDVLAALEACRGELGARDGSGGTGTTTQAPVS